MLLYTIKERHFKGLGFVFQKLYASNYKSYRKKIGPYTIWCWVAGKTIEINDWGMYTDNVLSFYKDNKHTTPPNWNIQLNTENGEVRFTDILEYYEQLHLNNMAYFAEWQQIYLLTDHIDNLLYEVSNLIN